MPSSGLFLRPPRAQLARSHVSMAHPLNVIRITCSWQPRAYLAFRASPSRSLTARARVSLAPLYRMLKSVSLPPVLLVVSMEVAPMHLHLPPNNAAPNNAPTGPPNSPPTNFHHPHPRPHRLHPHLHPHRLHPHPPPNKPQLLLLAQSPSLSRTVETPKHKTPNSHLSTLTPCTDGEQACVGGAFGQCVGSQFQVTQCSGGTQCFALPLVNKAGTSVTCTTEADASARIAATGATGGIQG